MESQIASGQTQIKQAFEGMEERLDVLEKEMVVLVDKLTPVMRNEPPESDIVKGVDEQTQVALAERILGNTQRINYAINNVKRLNNMCEL